MNVLCGDVFDGLQLLPSESVQCCVTSPPYWGLRDYGVDGQLGLEKTPEEYVQKMVDVFREVRRVLKDDGTLWLNLGDSYVANATGGLSNRPTLMTGGRANQVEAAKRPDKNVAGLKPKDLVGIPWRVAFALQADGWYLRSDIIWHKPNPMPESVTDRPTKAHEYLFLMSKSERYYYDHDAVKEPAVKGNAGSRFDTGKTGVNGAGRVQKGNREDHCTRNRRSVWTVATQPYKGAHFATFPPKLIEPCILAGSRDGDTVLDPFAGAGTTLLVAKRLNRKAIGIELNPDYVALIHTQVSEEVFS